MPADLQVVLSPDLISCLLRVLYEFVPDLLNRTFNITTFAEFQISGKIFEDFSAEIPKNTLIIQVLNSIATNLKRFSENKIPLEFTVSWICSKCNTMNGQETKNFYNNSNVSSIESSSFIIPFKINLDHSCGNKSFHFLKFDTPPLLHYVNFSDVFQNNTQKEGVQKNWEIKCKTKYGVPHKYYVHTLIFARKNGESYDFECSVVFSQGISTVYRGSAFRSFDSLVLIGAFYKLAKSREPEPDVLKFFAEIEDLNVMIEDFIEPGPANRNFDSWPAEDPSPKIEIAPILDIISSRDEDIAYIRKSYLLDHMEQILFTSVSHNTANSKSCKYCTTCGKYSPKQLLNCYNCLTAFANIENN